MATQTQLFQVLIRKESNQMFTKQEYTRLDKSLP